MSKTSWKEEESHDSAASAAQNQSAKFAVPEAQHTRQAHGESADFRRSGAIEAAAGGADAATISAKMANTLSASNALHATYLPVEINKVRAADDARRAGRAKLRENKK